MKLVGKVPDINNFHNWTRRDWYEWINYSKFLMREVTRISKLYIRYWDMQTNKRESM
jgi:hypothetical protein